ncbi:MAG: coproporphyrinogen III oxidase [Candidatus Schekmanbacteria bacterium]|nr:MAG: coproporphyrinogen III oxidase [Candidatus Schekmanbacteria bacterium]
MKKTFWLKYRNEPRGGLVGIAFDFPASEFDFAKKTAEIFIDTYFKIVEIRKDEKYTDEERERMLFKRGRWVEFNLIEDEGFRYGLEIGVNPEVMILQTLPPTVKF